MSVRQRLNFLPQGIGNAPSNATRDRMLVLTGKILTHMTSLDTTNSNGILPVERACAAFLPNQPDAAPSSADCPSSQASSDRDPACAAISTLLSYLQNASSARSQLCDLSDICQAAIKQCQPLLKERRVDVAFAGRQRSLPLRVLFVDDNAFARRYLERLARNRGYYYESCCDGESCVKVFEATLQADSNACDCFDLIIMDKEMPASESSGFRTAGVAAVKMIRELSKLHAEHNPGFRYPCIVGNTACAEEDDPTMIEFRNELELMRLQAGMRTEVLILKEKMSSWSDAFDEDVRRLCGLKDVAAADAFQLPLVWGKPIRLQMLFRNLITNAIQHGKPANGQHCVTVSYDLIDSRMRMHPCLTRSDQDNEVSRSLSWQLEGKFDDGAQRFVQVTVTDNGPGIDANNERMKRRLGQPLGGSMSSAPQAAIDQSADGPLPAGSVSNFGMCLRHIVCPEIANSHGAMGVHSRIEPLSGCSFVVALPHCAPAAAASVADQ